MRSLFLDGLSTRSRPLTDEWPGRAVPIVSISPMGDGLSHCRRFVVVGRLDGSIIHGSPSGIETMEQVLHALREG